MTHHMSVRIERWAPSLTRVSNGTWSHSVLQRVTSQVLKFSFSYSDKVKETFSIRRDPSCNVWRLSYVFSRSRSRANHDGQHCIEEHCIEIWTGWNPSSRYDTDVDAVSSATQCTPVNSHSCKRHSVIDWHQRSSGESSSSSTSTRRTYEVESPVQSKVCRSQNREYFPTRRGN